MKAIKVAIVFSDILCAVFFLLALVALVLFLTHQPSCDAATTYPDNTKCSISKP